MMDRMVEGWVKVRSWMMFGLGYALSPCCTPLIVPLVLALIAGTPAALWLSQHIGWVYAILTLISFVCLALGLWWMRRTQLTTRRDATRAEIKIVMRDLQKESSK